MSEKKKGKGQTAAENWINGNCTDAINACEHNGAVAAAALLFLLENYGTEELEWFGAALIKRKESRRRFRGERFTVSI